MTLCPKPGLFVSLLLIVSIINSICCYYSDCDIGISKVSISFRMTLPSFFIKNNMTFAFCKKKMMLCPKPACLNHFIWLSVLYNSIWGYYYKVSIGLKMMVLWFFIANKMALAFCEKKWCFVQNRDCLNRFSWLSVT